MAVLFFDYDGTLHDSLTIYAPAVRKAQEYLTGRQLNRRPPCTDKEISRWIGLTPSDMWNSFDSRLPQAEKEYCSQLVGEEMLQLTRQGKARLYPGTEQTLSALKKQGHTLLVLSSCKHSYMTMHREIFSLDRFFTDYYCGEDFGWRPKSDIFNEIGRLYTGKKIVIGDRFTDKETALVHHLPFIGCAYGFGTPEELRGADLLLNHIDELPAELQKILSEPPII